MCLSIQIKQENELSSVLTQAAPSECSHHGSFSFEWVTPSGLELDVSWSHSNSPLKVIGSVSFYHLLSYGFWYTVARKEFSIQFEVIGYPCENHANCLTVIYRPSPGVMFSRRKRKVSTTYISRTILRIYALEVKRSIHYKEMQISANESLLQNACMQTPFTYAIFTRDTFTWVNAVHTDSKTQYNRNVNFPQVNVSHVNTALICSLAEKQVKK